jgi:hypothetical protein
MPNHVDLYKLDPEDGTDSGGSGILSIDGVGVPSEVHGLAVHPFDCDLHAVLTYDDDQYLVEFDDLTPSGGYIVSSGSQAISKSGGDDDDLVDIDFDGVENLYGLAADAEVVSIDISSGVKSTVMSAVGTLGVGLRFSHDEPDSGWFFAVTGDGSSNYGVYTLLPYSAYLIQTFVGDPSDDTMGEAIAMDSGVGNAGKWHEISSDASHNMWLRDRTKSWNREEQEGAGCTDQCTAAVPSPDSATMPHWYP